MTAPGTGGGRGWRAWMMLPVLAGGILAVTWLGAQNPFVPHPPDEVSAVRNPHDTGGRRVCETCHPSMDRRIPPDPVALCTGCHDTGPVHQGHPVGAVLEAGLGAGLPLGDGRRVVCHTCHDPHDVVREPGGLRMAFTPLCRRCHEGH